MKPTPILTPTQVLFLNLFSGSSLTQTYYLSGGTALTGFYLPYRLSEDLDFFSIMEIDIQDVVVFLKSIKDRLRYKSFDLNTSFNRNIIFLKFPNEILKTEFTYYPFRQIEKPSKYKGINIDKPIDIATNKLFTIYQKPRIRDFMDLYVLCQKYDFTISNIKKHARIKFDWNIDPIKLGTQFIKVTELQDYPNLIQKLDEKLWQGFFLDEAKSLKTDILT